jgi:hypothetical protein
VKGSFLSICILKDATTPMEHNTCDVISLSVGQIVLRLSWTPRVNPETAEYSLHTYIQ